MSDQYLGEIRPFGFNFAPYNWAQCNGQMMSITQNAALFSLLGTNFGGNGQTTFGLPNLGGTVPMHWGDGAGLSSYVIGEAAGSPTQTITVAQMPLHSHAVQVAEQHATGESQSAPGPSAWLGTSQAAHAYLSNPTPSGQLAGNAIAPSGGSQPHQNMQPFLALNFCIALSGAFPPRG
jgi:microcystin-dependent protein